MLDVKLYILLELPSQLGDGPLPDQLLGQRSGCRPVLAQLSQLLSALVQGVVTVGAKLVQETDGQRLLRLEQGAV